MLFVFFVVTPLSGPSPALALQVFSAVINHKGHKGLRGLVVDGVFVFSGAGLVLQRILFDFELEGTEVDEQSVLEAGGLQIAHDLRGVFRGQQLDRLQL